MAARKSVSRTIDGLEVSTTRLAPLAALKLVPKIGKLLTPLLQLKSMAAIVEQHGLENVDVSSAVPVIDALFAQLDDKTIDLLCTELLVDTSITMPNDVGVMVTYELATKDMIDMAFGDEDGLPRLIAVLKFAGEVNFAKSFFALVQKLGARR